MEGSEGTLRQWKQEDRITFGLGIEIVGEREIPRYFRSAYYGRISKVFAKRDGVNFKERKQSFEAWN